MPTEKFIRGIGCGVDYERYGNLKFEEMFSAEGALLDGSVVMCGDIDDLLSEWIKYLLTRN